MSADPLPIDEALPDLIAAVTGGGQAVLQAPPGAGKTTRVPLALLRHVPGRIVMLEPRRLAARAAAGRMAATLGEAAGRTVGYRIRGESRTGPATRVEVVTEGILTRMIQADPELPGIGCLIFDEFHERSLHADLGLALALEVRGALRPDLALVVMSATLDAGPVAALMGAPVVTSEGRAFPVETRWLARPAEPRLDAAMAGLIRRAAEEEPGGILAFLPGEGEIRRVAGMLEGSGLEVLPLFGAMGLEAQAAALGPVAGRKCVLATSIAETSLTIPDIRIVVDGGRARRARFDPGSGMGRLVTERVTRAEADQRRGRAGRVGPGVCYRLWTKGEEGALASFPPPEIMVADLTGLALELALWGADALPFLTPPPAPALAEARALLADLGALDGGAITAHGRALAALPLHPRLGHMLVTAGKGAASLAALLADRDPLPGAGADLGLRLAALRDPARAPQASAALKRIRAELPRLTAAAPPDKGLTTGQMAALAYPDRVGQRRPGGEARFLLSGGKGAVVEPGDPLAQAPLIVVTDTDGHPREARVRQAAPITEGELRAVLGDRLARATLCHWDDRAGRVTARRQERLGALVLADRPWDAPPEALARAALDGLRARGLPWTPAARRLGARMALMEGFPDVSDAALTGDLGWLLLFVGQARTAADLAALDLTPALTARLTWDQQAQMDRLVPPHFTTPLGRQVPIDYAGDHPTITLRLQEMFGVTEHPTVGSARLPLRVVLLSPAQAPVQVTMDLPRFWATSYADVRRDMRGAYPRHPWPEDPTQAEPTLRAKPRGI